MHNLIDNSTAFISPLLNIFGVSSIWGWYIPKIFLLHFVLHFQMGDKNVFIKYLWLQAMTYFRNSSCKLRKLEKYLVKWSVSKQFPELWHLNVVCKDISFVVEKNYTLSFNEFFSQLNLRFLYMSTFPFPAITNLLFLPENLKSGQINKMKALSYNTIIYIWLYALFSELKTL